MKNRINNVLWMYREIWRISKLRYILIFFFSIIYTINLLVNIYFFKYIIDGIEMGKSIGYFVSIVMIRLGVLLIYQCCDNIFNNFAYKKIDLKIKHKLSLIMFDRVKRIDLSSINKPDFFDRYQRAINEIDKRATALLSTLSSTASTIFSLISMVYILFTLDFWLIFIAVVGMLITVWANIFNTKRWHSADKAFTRVDRSMKYINRVSYLPSCAKDLRLTNLLQYLKQRFETCVEQKQKLINKHWPPIIAAAVSSSWFYNVINVGIASLVLAIKVIRGIITIGDFTALTNVINNLSNQMLQFSSILPQYVQHALYIEHYREIIEYKSNLQVSNKNIQLEIDTPKSIQICNVSFCYPSSEKLSLKQINITIKAGEKIAIVGENGAGKSTLIKLIQHLYDPNVGSLKINDIPYVDLDPNLFHSMITSVEQDFQCYALSIKENIALSSNSQNIDEKRVWAVLDSVMLKEQIMSLPHSLDTEYTSEFDSDGIELSGGQLQRMAIARVLYVDSGIVIMDEPSSALDPISEAKIFDLIYKVLQNKTLIIISHKLSCVKDVDRIFVMDQGMIVEEGNHSTLMTLNGKYAQMFRTQSERYGN